MPNQPSYFSECEGAINALRQDVKNGEIAIYEIEQLPSGTLPASLAAKCSSAAVAVSGSGSAFYLAILPFRIDEDKKTATKVIDADPIIFAARSGAVDSYPTGVFIHHSDYSGRTTPISGYETCSCGQTVAFLKDTLITGIQPLGQSNPIYLEAIAHGIGHFDKLLGQSFEEWSAKTGTDVRPDAQHTPQSTIPQSPAKLTDAPETT